MSNWILYSAEKWLRPIVSAMRSELLRSDVINADETVIRKHNELSLNGKPWFVAADVCTMLEINNSADTLRNRLDNDEKGIASIYTLGGVQYLAVVTEDKRRKKLGLFKKGLLYGILYYG